MWWLLPVLPRPYWSLKDWAGPPAWWGLTVMEIFGRRNPQKWGGLEIGIRTNMRRFRRREVTTELNPCRLQPCNRATVQQCDSVTVQQCNSATVQQCKSTRVQECKSATVQECNSATMQQCNTGDLKQYRNNIFSTPEKPRGKFGFANLWVPG